MDDASNTAGMARQFLNRHVPAFKLAWVIVLTLVLLIPMGMIRSVLNERMERRNEAVAEITGSWGGEQTVVGPILVIPYEYKVKVWKDQIVMGKAERYEVEETRVGDTFHLPAELIVDGAIAPSRLHRGIYKAVVYEGELNISGRFAPPDFAELGIPEADVHWEEAALTLAVSDLRGTVDMLAIRIAGQDYALTPGCRLHGFESGISARLPGLQAGGSDLDFSMPLDLKGSRGISFAPVGRVNRVSMRSSWPIPSFRGAFLPANRKVTDEGFEAAWEMSWYGRRYGQQSADSPQGCPFTAETISPSLFGVDLLDSIDAYRMVERATKYAILFIALIFTAFFLFEALSALRIHTVQYTLVGAALCLFYLIVLSLSEFIPFAIAYISGAAASSLLITIYCLKMLRSGKRTAVIGAALATIYAYLYVALRLQNYSLLFGTAGLFVALAIVMFVTRNIDWTAGEKRPKQECCG